MKNKDCTRTFQNRRGQVPLWNIICLIIVFLMSVCFSGCRKDLSESEIKDINGGLIITTAQKYASEVIWFDSNFELLQTQKFEYAMLGSPFYNPVKVGEKFYIIPQGLGGRKDSKKVISFDEKTLKIEEYPFSNIALNHMACIGENIYAINTLNGDSYLESYNQSTKESKHIVIKNAYLKSIVASSEKLYCFIVSSHENNTKSIQMNVYTPDLQLIKQTNISDIGIPTKKYCEDEESLYLTVNLDKNDKLIGKILIVNKVDLTVSELVTSETGINDIYKYKDGLIFTYYDPVQIEGTKVSLRDKNGSEKIFDLGVKLTITSVIGDKFVIANNQMIRIYSIPDFKVLKEHKLNIDSAGYVSGFLAFDK